MIDRFIYTRIEEPMIWLGAEKKSLVDQFKAYFFGKKIGPLETRFFHSELIPQNRPKNIRTQKKIFSTNEICRDSSHATPRNRDNGAFFLEYITYGDVISLLEREEMIDGLSGILIDWQIFNIFLYENSFFRVL